MLLSDGREMTIAEFDALASAGAQSDLASCANCDCSYLNSDGKLVWAQCSAGKRFLCEYKGTYLVYTRMQDIFY